MPVTIVLGAQWGDEGKGKLVDILASSADLVARAAGGNNAGHTIVVDSVTYDFHILPSGLINPSCKYNLIGTGCVVHIPSFFKELAGLEEKGLQGVRDRILISDRAQVCFDLHGVVDGVSEDKSKSVDGGKNMIGTTRKGIGPCYSDKVARQGVTFWMLVNEQQRWEPRLRALEADYRKLHGDEALRGYSVEEEIEKLKGWRDELQRYVVDQTPLLASALGNRGIVANSSPQSSKMNILIEGANALLLDIDHGTYPYVTSSNTGLGGVFTGLAGLSPQALSLPGSNIVGVVKAYTTRVGSGPFPTELDASISPVDADYGERLQRVGREFGVTTGRKRRCGWFDLVLVKYSAAVNCYTQLNLTKLDVLDEFEEIRVATSYITKNGTVLESFPADLDIMDSTMKIQYKTFPGWKTSTTGVRNFADLPEQAKSYVEFIEREVAVPIKWIGTGPRREDMCVR